MAKYDNYLADIRREEHYKQMMGPDLHVRDLCEMVKAHFESHPTLPGEKDFKNYVNTLIEENEWGGTLMTVGMEDIARRYSHTRIRSLEMEGPIAMEGVEYKMSWLDGKEGGIVDIHSMDVELQRSDKSVYVMAENYSGGMQIVGRLSEAAVKNNPMNVDSCKAELQITDFSNGNMKNVSYRVVADTDLMSGDVIDLDENMLPAMDESKTMEQ